MLFSAGTARAAGPLDGLEMDVIEPGQRPVVPAARIALPQAPGADAGSIYGIGDSLADSALGPAGATAGAADRDGEDAVAAPTGESK